MLYYVMYNFRRAPPLPGGISSSLPNRCAHFPKMLLIGVKKPETAPSTPLCAAPPAPPSAAFASTGATAGGSIITIGAALPFAAL